MTRGGPVEHRHAIAGAGPRRPVRGCTPGWSSRTVSVVPTRGYLNNGVPFLVLGRCPRSLACTRARTRLRLAFNVTIERDTIFRIVRIFCSRPSAPPSAGDRRRSVPEDRTRTASHRDPASPSVADRSAPCLCCRTRCFAIERHRLHSQQRVQLIAVAGSEFPSLSNHPNQRASSHQSGARRSRDRLVGKIPLKPSTSGAII